MVHISLYNTLIVKYIIGRPGPTWQISRLYNTLIVKYIIVDLGRFVVLGRLYNTLIVKYIIGHFSNNYLLIYDYYSFFCF